MTSSIKLRLYEMADELEEYSVDNGPMGEDYPFKAMAKELRKLARGEEDYPFKPMTKTLTIVKNLPPSRA